MNDDEIEQQLKLAFQDRPSPDLRSRVLAKVNQELHTTRVRHRSTAWLVAASLMMALTLNLLSGMVVRQRLTTYLEPDRAPWDRLDRPSQSNALSVAVAPPAWMQWLAASSVSDREDFERYTRNLVARSTQYEVQHLP